MVLLAGLFVRPTAANDAGDPGVWGSNEGEDMVRGQGDAGVSSTSV